jgi:transcriptional regulator with XRE-family HTH domain
MLARVAGKKARVPKNIVGPQVARLRYQQGLSQSDLAAKCQRVGWDASRGIIAGIEGQVRRVTDSQFVLLAQVLSVPLDGLLPSGSP